MSTQNTIALLALSTFVVSCSDWGFTLFQRDPCRRDPAACPPEDEPRQCDTLAAPRQPITELVCKRETSEWSAELFWEQALPTNGGTRYVLPPDRAHPADGALLSGLNTTVVDDVPYFDVRRGVDGTLIPKIAIPDAEYTSTPHVEADGSIWTVVGFEDGRLSAMSFDGRTTVIPNGETGGYPYSAPLGDFNADGVLDRGGARRIFDRDNNIIVQVSDAIDAPLNQLVDIVATADVTGDGRRELLSYNGIVRRGSHYLCRTEPATHFVVADLELNGEVDILTSGWGYGGEPSKLQILSPQCEPLKSTTPSDVLPPGAIDSGSSIVAVAPLLQPDRMAIAIQVSLFGELRAELGASGLAIFDHELRFVRLVSRVGLPVADLDGDGVYEGLASKPWTDRSQPRPDGIYVFDFRTSEYHLLTEGILGAGPATFADIDGDGRGELVATVIDEEGQAWIRAFKGAGPGFAAALPFQPTWALPYLYNPDGTPSKDPIRWDRVGMYGANPGGGWWAAVDADLRVRFTDVCESDCSEGWLTYTVQVGNHGHGDVGADVLVRVYGERDTERTMLSEQRYRDVYSGEWSAAEPIAVRYQGQAFDRLRAVVQPDGWESQECDKTNNEAIWNLDCP